MARVPYGAGATQTTRGNRPPMPNWVRQGHPADAGLAPATWVRGTRRVTLGTRLPR